MARVLRAFGGGVPGGALFEDEPFGFSVFDKDQSPIGDVTAGISPEMRRSMTAQTGQNRALVQALMQNPLFANDPEVMASLAGSFEAGAGPRGDTLMGPQVENVLRTQRQLRSQQVAKGGEEILGMQTGNEAARFKANTAAGVGPELSATQKALLGVKEEDITPQALRRYVSGQASESEKRYVEEQILPTLAAERRKTEAGAGLAEAQSSEAKARAAATEAQGSMFKNPLMQSMLKTMFSHSLKEGDTNVAQLEKAKTDISKMIEEYYSRSIAINAQTNPKLAATMDRVFEMQLQQMIAKHERSLATPEGRRFLAKTLSLLLPQQTGAGGGQGSPGLNPNTFMQGAP